MGRNPEWAMAQECTRPGVGKGGLHGHSLPGFPGRGRDGFYPFFKAPAAGYSVPPDPRKKRCPVSWSPRFEISFEIHFNPHFFAMRFLIPSLLLLSGVASAQVSINEIRVGDVGPDLNEYFELRVAPGESLAV